MYLSSLAKLRVMAGKFSQCLVSSLNTSKLWTKSAIISRPCKWNLLMHSLQRPALQKASRNYSFSWFLCSRFHMINYGQHLNNRHISAFDTRLSISASTLRHYSSLHEQCHKDTEEDTLYKWIELRCKGHDDAVLESYQTFVSMAAQELDIHVESILKPRRKIERISILKSRFIYKKHQVQYEWRTHYRVITLKHLTGSTADVFLEYIERNLPEGVAMQVRKCHLEKVPEHITAPTDEAEDEAKLSDDTRNHGDVCNQATAVSSSSGEESGSSSSDSDSDSEKHQKT